MPESFASSYQGVTQDGDRLEAVFERRLPVDGPPELAVELDSGAIQIKRGEAGEVRFRGILRARRSLFGWGDTHDRMESLVANPPIRQSGRRIQAGDDMGGESFDGLTVVLEIFCPGETSVFGKVDTGSIKVTGLSGAIKCEADSGSVEICGVSGNVRVKVDSGSIEVNGVSGAVRAEADSGEISIRDVQGSVHATADSGRIEALQIAGSIEVETDSGEMLLSQTAVAPIRAKADSGSITVTLAPGAGYDVRARSDSGAVTLPELTLEHRDSRRDIRGRIRGGGPGLDLEVDSGSIHVQ